MRRSPLPLALSGLLAAAPAFAEGARLTLDCTVTRFCTAPTVCEPVDAPVTLVFAPEATDATGAGDYVLSMNGLAHAAQGQSAIGPFVWEDGTETLTLTLLSETEATVAAVRRDDPAATSLTELDCAVTQ